MSKDFVMPTSENLKELMKLKGWTQNDVAKLTRSSLATIKKWCLSSNSKGNRQIPYTAWRLLVSYTGISLADKREEEIILGK
jgi:transcriptional regulator with XRE-family HTH domain